MDKKLALECFKRDGFKCRYCGSRNDLTAHHIIYRSQNGPDVLVNLLTLCFFCHRDIHDKKLLINVIDILPDNVVVWFERLI